MSSQSFGPWAAVKDSTNSHIVVAQRQRYKDWGEPWEPHSGDANVCMSIGDHTDPPLAGHDSQMAMAHLMAAAPDMLAALEEAREALAYALKHAAPGMYDTPEQVAGHCAVATMDKAIHKATEGIRRASEQKEPAA